MFEGYARLEAPTIVEQLGKINAGSVAAKLLATTTFGSCPYDPPNPNADFLKFKKPKPKPARPAVSGLQPIKIVQYTDTHTDEGYKAGSSYKCNDPYCCRGPAVSTSFPAGPFGNRNCDVPLDLEHSMYMAINETVPDAKLTLFTGDIINHFLWETTEDWNRGNITGAYDRMAQWGNSFQHIYGTIGNHEAHPVNLFPTKNLGHGVSWVYDVVAKAWARWLGSTASEAETAGYYSARYADSKLRIISINTNYYYKLNWWTYQDPMLQDPDGQFQWLINELQDAEDTEDRVYIIGHMPMGSDDTLHMYSNYFDQIVNRYENTIAALFFGHTHMDEIQIAYRDHSQAPSSSSASAVSYVCPALHPGDGNPTFRVYDVDPVTFAVLDSTTYYADMDAVGFQKSPKWVKFYSAKESYGSSIAVAGPNDELTPAWWHNVSESFKTDHAKMQAYVKHKNRGYQDPKKPNTCDSACAADEICQMRAMRAQDNCQKPGLHFTKRAVPEDDVDDNDSSVEDGNGANADTDEDPAHHDQCGMSAIAIAFGTLATNRTAFDIFVNAVNSTTAGHTNGTSPGNSTSTIGIHRPLLKARDDVMAFLLSRER